jgi:signal transduction histidine kinase
VISANRQEVELAALARQVVDEVDAGGHAVSLSGGPVYAEVDAAKVERIVENLLTNAIRHTPPGTRVWVRVEAVDGTASIVVEDDGPGVGAEQREAIFEPFQRGGVGDGHGNGNGSNASNAPGMGIGLSLVAKFAELHGGRAWVQEREGGGASFRVVLPPRLPA